MSLLEQINEYPYAGAMLLVGMLLVHQIIAKWRGTQNVSKFESESNRLAKQTSETVNKCAEKANVLMEAIERHLAKNDLGHVSAQLHDAVQMLEKMADHQGRCVASLDRVSSLCRSIADDIQKTDSRIVHAQIGSKITSVQAIVDDIKRIVISFKEGK